ncbi:MAG TPA: acyl carrier protein [Polyangiales bacterium]
MISEAKIKQILALLLDADQDALRGDSVLAEIEGWDSVNALRVLVYLERESGGAVDYDRFMAARSLADLGNTLVAAQLSATP